MKSTYFAVLSLALTGLALPAADHELETEASRHNERVLTLVNEARAKRPNAFVSGTNLVVMEAALDKLGHRSRRHPLNESSHLLRAFSSVGDQAFPFKVSALITSPEKERIQLPCPVTTFQLDLSKPQSFLEVNSWAKDFTQGAVVEPFRVASRDLDLLDTQTRFVGSLSYLRASWSEKSLRENRSREVVFHLPDGKKVPLSAVRARTSQEFSQDARFWAVALELEQTAQIRAAIVTARPGEKLAELREWDWRDLSRSFRKADMELVIPQFLGSLLNELSTYSVLISARDRADVGEMLHAAVQLRSEKTQITLRGTEEKANTAQLEILTIPALSIEVNSPFYFVLYHVESGALMSAYRLEDPRAWLIGNK